MIRPMKEGRPLLQGIGLSLWMLTSAQAEPVGLQRPLDLRADEARCGELGCVLGECVTRNVSQAPDWLWTRARLVPNFRDGQTVGFRLYAVRPGSLVARLGIANGDTLLAVNDEPLVSIDFNHNPHSSIFHMDQTKVMDGNMVSIMSWYDNEWGFSTRMSDTAIAWGKLPAEYYSFDETFPEPEGALCTNYNPSDVDYTNLVAQSATVVADSWAQGDPAYTGPCIDLFHYDPQPDGYRMRLGIYEAG